MLQVVPEDPCVDNPTDKSLNNIRQTLLYCLLPKTAKSRITHSICRIQSGLDVSCSALLSAGQVEVQLQMAGLLKASYS